jgi:hypothetical protein
VNIYNNSWKAYAARRSFIIAVEQTELLIRLRQGKYMKPIRNGYVHTIMKELYVSNVNLAYELFWKTPIIALSLSLALGQIHSCGIWICNSRLILSGVAKRYRGNVESEPVP